MNKKKHTVNERISILEKMCYKLAIELNAVITAINMTVKDKDEPK